MLLVAHRTPPTAAGCAAFVAAGAAMFESDVQLRGTPEQVVVSHYLPFLRVPGWFEHDGPRFRWRGGTVRHDPTLAQVGELVPSEAMILLDPKETEAGRRARLVDSLDRGLPDRERFRVSTDRPDDLARYRSAGFTTWRTVKTETALRELLREPGDLPDAGVSIRASLLDAATVRALRAVTPVVVAWTVNQVVRAVELAELGVDGVTTDSRDVMRAVRSSPGV